MIAPPDLVLRGGRIVGEHGVAERDLLISGGKVGAWLAPGEPAAATEASVRGRYLMPGLIDAHVHFREPGLTWKEDFSSGTRSAIAGGVTTALVMPTDDPWTVSAQDLAAKRKLSSGRIFCDIGLQAAVRRDLGSVREAAALRPVSFEVFTADVGDDFLHGCAADLIATLASLAEFGVPVCVSPGDESLLRRALAGLGTGRSTPQDFVASRSSHAEALGVAQIILGAAATGARVHIRQINSALGIETVRRLRHLADVTVETSPQNWTFSSIDYDRLGPAAKASPPFRTEADRSAVTDALREGLFDIVVTDHAPHLLAEKEAGRGDFASIPGGFPGVQSLLTTLLALVAADTLQLTDVARVAAARPAEIFGLARKGRLAPGCDADVLVVDPGREHVVRGRDLFSKARFTPFEGLSAPFTLERVFLRGAEVFRDGEILDGPQGRIVVSGQDEWVF